MAKEKKQTMFDLSKIKANPENPFPASSEDEHQLQRNCYGMELDEKYCQVGVDRMLTLDPEIKLFRNGEDVTDKYRSKLTNGQETV